MARLPDCPNYREGKGCPRSDLILAGENERFYAFHCRTCGLQWMWTKPREKAAASYENEMKKVREKTEQYRKQEERAVAFSAPKGGWL